MEKERVVKLQRNLTNQNQQLGGSVEALGDRTQQPVPKLASE